MDQKLVLCMSSLKDEAEAVRVGAASADLNSLVADVSDLCKQAVSDEDISFAIAVIFDKESGIFSVLESVLTIKERTVVKARESCCTLIADFIEQIGERAAPHVAFVKEKCFNVLRRDDSKVVQAAALTPLLAMLETREALENPFHFHVDRNLAEILLHEYRKAKTSGTLRANILILLGYLVEYFPEVFGEGDANNILKICLDTLEEQLRQTTKDPSVVLVSGVIKCVDSLLTRYDDSIPAGGSIENARKLYTFLKQVVCYREDMKRYDTVRAGLRLLSRHAGRFALRLMQDAKDIFGWLQTYCTHNNAPLRDAGFAAFNQFISQVSWCLLNEENRVHNIQAVYKYFMAAFFDILDTQYKDAKLLLSLAVKGLGKLSPAIVKFSGKETLRQVFHRLIPFGGSTSRSGEDQDYLLGHSDNLIGAFADIVIHLDTVEDFMVSFVAEVTGNIFYQFPQLFPKQKKAICVTLSMLFKSLFLKGTIFSIFINNIVWSSLERAMESTMATGEMSLPLWPQYVELWSNILNCSNQGTTQGAVEKISGPDGKELEIDISQFQQFMFDAILRCLMKTLKELNLTYRVKASDKQAPSALQDDAESAGTLEPETELEMIEPLNNEDMRKYLNLVEFIQDLLSGPWTSLFLKWVCQFGCCLMELANKYPLISGQYKLLTITIKNADAWRYFQSSDEGISSSHVIKMDGETPSLLGEKPSAKEDAYLLVPSEEREKCKFLFRHFLHEVVIASRRYKLELLASCLRLCLSAPPALVDISSLVAPMQTTLKIGLRYPPLAAVAVDALERWHQNYPRELEIWLPDVASFLGDYLGEAKSVEVSDVLPAVDPLAQQDKYGGGGSATASLSRSQLARMRQTRAKANQPRPFEVIQLRVQKFLGQIGHFNHHLVPEMDLLQVAGTGGLAWDSIDRVQFTFPFKNEKYDVWLDSLLPRVVELAISSSDRSTKVSASELLQALCLVMLGNSAKGPIHRKNGKSHSIHLDKIYRRLFPAILRLAVDVELVTRQLFNEFAKQLIHWYTSNQQKENPETVALLDAILDGLVDFDNGSLREYCATCLGEFMSWSVRHAPPEANDFVNVKSILRRLYNRMDHPNPYQRLGASMAAFCIYPVLRGTPSIVNRHIFEILFFCIKSLQLAEGDDNQIGTIKQMNKTLDIYMKLVNRNIYALQQVQKGRPMFLSLEDFLQWLLLQTEQMQETCRSRCMSLLSSICRSLPVGSLAGWFRSSLCDTVTIHTYIKRVEFQLESLSVEKTGWSVDEADRQLSAFIRSLDWFTWALNEKLITTEELQVNAKCGPVVERFLHRIVSAPESNRQTDTMTPRQRESHQRLQCTSIVHLLRFMKQILDIELQIDKKGSIFLRDVTKVPINIGLLEELIPVGEPNFHEMICLALLRPRDLGFVITDPQKAEELAGLALYVIKLLTGTSVLFKSRLTTRLQALLSEDKFDVSEVSLSLDNGGKEKGSPLEDAASLLKGYQQLYLSGSLLSVLGKEKAKRMGEKLLLRVVQIGRECPPALESIASEMLSLSRVLGTTVKRLVEICTDDHIFTTSSNARNISSGGIFYLNFRRIIIRLVKFAFEECLAMLLHAAVSNSTGRLLLNAILDDFIAKREAGDSMSQGGFMRELLKHLKVLQPCVASGLADKQFLLDIMHKLLLLDRSNDLLRHDQCAIRFMEETYVSFITGFRNLQDDIGNSSQRDSNFALQSQSIMLLPFFLTSPFDGDFGFRIGNAMTKMVSDHLLVREIDLLANSNQRSSYLQMLSRLLEAISISCNLVLLEVIFPLLLNPPNFVVKRLSETLYKFAENIGEKRQDSFDLCVRLLHDDTKLPQLRLAVMEKVFVPLVDMAPVDFVVTWYTERVKSFMDELGKPPSNRDAEKEAESLMVKICHYSMVERLFLRVEASMIKEKITPLVLNAVLIKQTMGESRAKNDPARTFPENATLWRQLHVSAYNCLAAVAVRTQEQEKIFSLLFKEGPTGMIWQHLIDTNKVYDKFPVETNHSNVVSLNVKEMRDKQKARIRSRGNTSGGVLNTLSSQYFAGAGLSQEPALIDTFVSRRKGSRAGDDAASLGTKLDDPGGSLYAAEAEPHLNEVGGSSEAVVDTSELDQDDFDLHPCMPVVLKLIEHLHLKFGKGNQDMPEWMKGLHWTLQNSATHANICLFLTKVVTKCWKVFAPYSQVWFRPMTQTILRDARSSGGTSFHYMLRDICITILQWNFTSPPDTGVASAFINHLMSVAVHGSNQVLRQNVDIIRLFVESWKDHIQLERQIILNYLCAGGKAASSSDRSLRTQRILGLQLLGVTVTSGLPMYDPVIDHFSERDLYHGLLQNLNFKWKEVYEAAGELVGMALKQQHGSTVGFDAPTDKTLLEVPLKQLLLNLVRDGTIDAFLNILSKITLRFPEYVEGFTSTLIDMLPKLQGVFKGVALDIFLRFPGSVSGLLHVLLPSLVKLLTHRDEAAQFKALQLLMELLKETSDRVIVERVLPSLCETFVTHESVDCRQQFFSILVNLYERDGINSDRLITPSLLAGLTDRADVVRLRLQNFWHGQLSQDLGERMIQLINEMHDPAVEECWAPFANVLMLKLCEESVDYKRPIFNAPLSDCEFREQTINTSWLESSLPMTPLFSQSQSISQSSQDGRSQVIQSSQEPNPGVPGQAGFIRGTLNSTLTQSQDPFASSVRPSQESALFAMSRRSRETQTEGTMHGSSTLDEFTIPRRRIPTANAARSQIIRAVTNANRRREARLAQQVNERGNKVQMMRRYRTGELPDIEIKYEEILAPMAALAERDATFARLLLTLICRAVYARPRFLTRAGEDEDVKSSMKKGIERALETTNNGTSFIGCMQSLCLEDPQIWIRPQLVGRAALKSTNFQSGILLLETQILHAISEESPSWHPSAKRQRGATGTMAPHKSNVREAWLELANLYSELGEDDVVLSIYRRNLSTKPITHKALEAQLGGDSSRGLILYDQALDTMEDSSGSEDKMTSHIEQDIWYNQRLVCLADLNRWQQIVADTLVQIQDEDSSDTDLQRLWDPRVREPYLDLFMRGAIKVAAHRYAAASFVQTSLEDPGKRDVLMNQYGSQLALLAVMDCQLDRARFYLSQCYRTFRKQWTTLHQLAVGARHHLVQKLQKLVELDEYVELVSSQQFAANLNRTLQEWKNRWPSAREDGVEAWDDIVQNRLIFFKNFETLIGERLDPRESDARTEFLLRLDEERAQALRHAARGLTKQGAYTAAQTYLEEHHSAQRGPGRDKQDYESIKSLVKLRCLQADRVQIAQPREARDMLQQVLSYIKANAQTPGLDQNPTRQMDLKLLQARVSVQLSLNNLAFLHKDAAPSPAAVSECLALLGDAYVAYSQILSSTSGQTMSHRRLTKVSLKFGQFCDELLQTTKNADWSEEARAGIVQGHPQSGLPGASCYPTLVVKHIMNAIVSDTSLRAQHGVARLLSLVGQYPETHEEFRSRIGRVPSWVFIPWIPQMLAVMEQSEGGLFVGILEDIARSYPQALYFGFHVSEKDFGSEGRTRTHVLAQLLKNDCLRGFVRALEDLTFPEQRLRDGLGQIKTCLTASDGRKAQALFAALAEDCLDEKRMGGSSRLAGEYNCKFARDWSQRVRKLFGDDGSKLLSMDEEGFKAATKGLMATLQKAMHGLQSGVMSLGLLSQWMAKFDPSATDRSGTAASSGSGYDDHPGTDKTVEIPGQYDGFRKPGRAPHVRLAGFDQNLVSLTSKQRPKVLTMRGSDEKEYKFVVKGGEDIRLDQRIEQLFEVMNGILRSDAAAARRGLRMRTYAVVPVSTSCGLLQFVENTSVLEDVVKDGLVCKIPGLAADGKDAPAAFLNNLKGQYHEWVAKRGGPARGPPVETFTNLYSRAGREDIEEMLASVRAQLPWDTLRAGVARWATSAESFLALRSSLAKSLAAGSICGYVAGVGDRHLGNTLVDMRTGALVAIDFGYSFGTGVILLPVPELVPFRLTPQMTDILRPLDALGLLRADMVHALAALRAGRHVIAAVMDVFVKEPLVEWRTEAMRARGARDDDDDGRGPGPEQRERRFVELKVENAKRKLQLWNPAAVTVAELRSSVHARRPYLGALEAIVRGGPERNVRARVLGDTCASVHEQVDCLIDQATDPNLLGRTWTGWQPWV